MVDDGLGDEIDVEEMGEDEEPEEMPEEDPQREMSEEQCKYMVTRGIYSLRLSCVFNLFPSEKPLT